MDFLLDLIMELIPDLLGERWTMAAYRRLASIPNKPLRYFLTLIAMLLSIIVAIALAFGLIVAIFWLYTRFFPQG
ncbi:hypothetical protein [Proteiniclasticum sp. QWL-01]|uniref:hypothetical protein n=1 Tax=Proteiniclasticum sp. QWL-01 TaxID=3036945 RepID=UPI0022094C35|nr:hypothetical protein [Proteiniclasticum sp. QWL-01]UUM11275.1 hypothetical protein NQU17_11530 [Clostridiaceae bacterium HFYG-1003]WFF72613.1 hypothetical protein P6M73_15275 [Proteiniclasticum sp. QWL-01]